MNFDHNFFQVSKLNEDQKKRSSPKMEHFFPRIQVKTKKKVFTKEGTLFPQIQVETCAQMHSAHQSQIIGGNADVDHTQIIVGDIPPPSPGFRTPVCQRKFFVR